MELKNTHIFSIFYSIIGMFCFLYTFADEHFLLDQNAYYFLSDFYPPDFFIPHPGSPAEAEVLLAAAKHYLGLGTHLKNIWLTSSKLIVR